MLLFENISSYLSSDVTAIRAITRLQPVGGPGSKLFPPTYEGGKYAFEKRWVDGHQVDAVLLDAVQSQANRMESALLNACLDGCVNLPLLRIAIPGHGTITTLDAPHRVHDAIFRDSLWGGKPFRQSPDGKRLVDARPVNATAFFEFCPTALLFGTWDSQGGGGVTSAKVPRAIASEIVGLDAVRGVRTSSRIDPLGIQAMEGKVFKAAKSEEQWTLDEATAEKSNGKPAVFGKKGKPSEINHGNIAPSITDASNGAGGVTIREAMQTTVLSFTQFRRLRFPDADGKVDPKRDAAGRTVLAALGLYAFLLTWDEGMELRSRCHLVAIHEPKLEVIRRVIGEPETFTASSEEAKEALEQALDGAKKSGLTWHADPIDLQPTEKLLKLVRLSDASTETVLAAEA